MSETMAITSDELAGIEAMLSDLTMPAEAIEEIADMEAAPADIIEEDVAPLNETEIDEIASAVAAIEAEGPVMEIELTATEISVQPVIEPAAEPVIDVGAVDIEAALRELDVESAKQAAYAEQDETAIEQDASIKPSEAPPTKTAATKTSKTPKAASTPKAPRGTVNDLPVEAFVLDTNIDDTDAAAMAANKTAVMARRPAQVKVAEKFDNALLSIAAGKLPSTYTVDCYRVLKAAGTTNSASLAAALTATSKKSNVSATYTIGTARSQAGQFMALAPALKIATRSGKELVLNPDSTIAMALDTLLGL